MGDWYYDNVNLPDLAHVSADPKIREEKEFLSPLLQGLDLLKNSGHINYWIEREYNSSEKLIIVPTKRQYDSDYRTTVDIENIDLKKLNTRQMYAAGSFTLLGGSSVSMYPRDTLLSRHQLLQAVFDRLLLCTNNRTERKEIKDLRQKIDSIPDIQSERSVLSKWMDRFRNASEKDFPPPVNTLTDLHYCLSKETWRHPNFRQSEEIIRIIEPDNDIPPSDRTLADRFFQEWKSASSNMPPPFSGFPTHAQIVSHELHVPARELLGVASKYTGMHFNK